MQSRKRIKKNSTICSNVQSILSVLSRLFSTTINFSDASSSKNHNDETAQSFNQIETNEIAISNEKDSKKINFNNVFVTFDQTHFLWSESRRKNNYKSNVFHEMIMQMMKSYLVFLLISVSLNDLNCTSWLKRTKIMINNLMQITWKKMTLFIKRKSKKCRRD